MEKIRALTLNSLELLKLPKIKGPRLNKPAKLFIVMSSTLVFFVALITLGFLGYEKVYADQFYPGVKIAQLDSNGQDKSDMASLLVQKIEQLEKQEITLSINSQIKSVVLEDLGVSFNAEKLLAEAWDFTRQGNLWQRFSRSLEVVWQEKNFALPVVFNEEKLVAKLNELAGEAVKEATNATIAVSKEKLRVVVEEAGQKVDISQFQEDLQNYLAGQNSSLISLNFLQIEPEIYSYQVEAILPEMEMMVFPEIVLMDQEKNQAYTADPTQIAQWLVLKAHNDQLPSIELSNEKITDFVQALAKKIDQKKINRKIKEKDGSLISEGQDGRTLDQTQAISAIEELLIDRKIAKNPANVIELIVSFQERGEEKVAVWEASPAGGGSPGLSEGKYIEINLSEQRLYLFEGNQAVDSFMVSTGKWSTPTPIGTRYIEGKSERAWSAKYGLYLPWWNSLGGGYGIHELPEWPGGKKEGEDHLGTPVSHGCIRLGVGPAEFVYNWAPEGTPVFIHK